jgi:hypothetical protein
MVDHASLSSCILYQLKITCGYHFKGCHIYERTVACELSVWSLGTIIHSAQHYSKFVYYGGLYRGDFNNLGKLKALLWLVDLNLLLGDPMKSQVLAKVLLVLFIEAE